MTKKSFIVALLSLFAAASFAADGGIVYVNFDRIYRESKVVNAVRDDINVEFREREEALTAVGEKLREMQEELEKESLALSDGEKESRRRAIADEERNFIRDRRALAEDVSLRFQERRRVIDSEISRIINELAKDRSYSMVINPHMVLPLPGDRALTHNVILYAEDSVDITEEVIELFDKKAAISR